MIFRVTQKLAKKIKVVPSAPLAPDASPLLDWTANLFMVSRWQCILLSNSLCLYSIVMAGKGIPNEKAFVEQSMRAMRDHMALDGLANIFDTHIAAAMDSVVLCKAGDRRVLGSMNDLVFQAKCYLLEMGLSIELVNMRLNETPLSMVKYHNPKLSFLSLVEKQ